jgi:Flp pilus assembly protein TadG
MINRSTRKEPRFPKRASRSALAGRKGRSDGTRSEAEMGPVSMKESRSALAGRKGRTGGTRSEAEMGPVSMKESSHEHGAASVEFGLVFVLLVFVFAGVVDLALMLQTKRNLSDSVRAAARSGAQACIGSASCTAGNPQDADATAVAAVRSVLGSSAKDVSKIIIYQSPAANMGVPADCLATTLDGIAGKCNVVRSPFAGAAVSIPTLWPIGTRVRNAANAEYMGIFVEFNYQNPVAIFGGNRTLKSQSAFRLEPPASETATAAVLPEYPSPIEGTNWRAPTGPDPYVAPLLPGPANGGG